MRCDAMIISDENLKSVDCFFAPSVEWHTHTHDHVISDIYNTIYCDWLLLRNELRLWFISSIKNLGKSIACRVTFYSFKFQHKLNWPIVYGFWARQSAASSNWFNSERLWNCIHSWFWLFIRTNPIKQATNEHWTLARLAMDKCEYE